MPALPGRYTLSWRIRLENPSGWYSDPVHFTLSKNGVQVDEHKCYISTSSDISSQRVGQFKLPTIRVLENGWREYDAGDFVVDEGEEISHLKFAVRSHVGDGKTGIFMDGVIVQPQSSVLRMAEALSAPHEFINSRTETGRGCWSLGARELRITWGNDPRYWSWVSDQTSLHSEVARLEVVTWFEVSGELKCPLPRGTYTLSWRIRLENPSGWYSDPVHFTLSKNGVQVDERKCYISTGSEVSSRRVEQFQLPLIRVMENGWREYDAGDFVVDEEEDISHLKFAMRSFVGDGKTGIALDGIVVQPMSTATIAERTLGKSVGDVHKNSL